MSENRPELNLIPEEINEVIDEAVEMAETVEITDAAIEEAVAEAIEVAETTDAVEEAAEEAVEAAAINPNQCLKCGFVLEDDQLFCPKCGTKKGKNPALICKKCGADLLPGQEFCTGCGQKVTSASAVSKLFAGLAEKYKGLNKGLKIAIPAVLAALLIAAVVLGIVAGNAGKDFRRMFPDYAGQKWATFASDGTWMHIDSNPEDIDDEDYYDYTTLLAADAAVTSVNTQLGFPSSIVNKMNNTTWSMGPQSESTKKYMVTWTYHPDKGLEVLYEVIK